MTQKALQQAKLSPEEVDYIKPHGTGSVIGDEIELKALLACGLSHAYINTTKSIIGHGLSGAGAVEVIATLLQVKKSCLHPSRNFEKPIELSCMGERTTHPACHSARLKFKLWIRWNQHCRLFKKI